LTTFVGCFEATVYCPSSFSLKDKRQAIKSILDRIKNKFNVSVAEVDHQDHHRMARVAFGVVGSEQNQLEQYFDQIENELLKKHEIDVREINRTIF